MICNIGLKNFLKFLIVGFINTLFGYCVFALLIYLNIHYTIASFVATVLGVLFNFKTYGKFVFNNTNWDRIFLFISVYATIYTINILGLFIFKSFGINEYIAGAILIIPMALLGYFLNKRFVYGQKNN